MNDPNSQNRLDPTARAAPVARPNDQGNGQAGSQPTLENNNDPVVEINGEKVPLNEVQKGYMRQSDYTQKTQALAAERKRLEEERKAFTASSQHTPPANDPDAELREGVNAIKQIGEFATVKEVDEKLTAFQMAQEDERNFQKVISANEKLKPYEDILRDLGQANPTMAWEDIVEKKLSKVINGNPVEQALGSREAVGNPSYVKPEKNILDMDEREWAEYKRNRGGSNRTYDGKFVKQVQPTYNPN